MKHFIFPADPLNHKRIDPEFADQVDALYLAGFGVSRLTDDMKVFPKPAEGDVAVYRGWMMDKDGYEWYLQNLAAWEITPLTNLEQYLAAHWLPNWYPLVESLTPETLVFPEGNNTEWKATEAARWALEGHRIQIKDYVKSLKTGRGSVVSGPDEIAAVLADMEQFRGKVEGGVCLRKYEDLSATNERRYFVINGKFYGQDELFDTRAMEILIRVARDIPSPFFSVDISQHRDGRFRIVEIGDGQVSDLVGWTPERFAEIWKRSES